MQDFIRKSVGYLKSVFATRNRPVISNCTIFARKNYFMNFCLSFLRIKFSPRFNNKNNTIGYGQRMWGREFLKHYFLILIICVIEKLRSKKCRAILWTSTRTFIVLVPLLSIWIVWCWSFYDVLIRLLVFVDFNSISTQPSQVS